MSEPHLARKRFGQNFLSDKNIIYKIIEAIRPDPRPTAWSRSARALAR
jgi:16S rRNA (adenine1518-N6/adenine1519-N6)-dimethyltransferase